MSNPLAAHPPWRQLLIVSVVLPAVAVLAVLAFGWPNARVAPRDLPVGVVGTGPAATQVVSHVSGARPGAFDFRLYGDVADARSAIRHRDVYGAFVVTSTATSTGARPEVQVLTAGAAGPAVSQVLTQVAEKIAPGHVRTADVVPLATSDPRGTVLATLALPMTICAILAAAVVGVIVRMRPAWRQLFALTVVSAVAGAGVYLIAQPFLGALPHNGVGDWAALALTMLAASVGTAGLVALIGAPGLGLAAALLITVGNPFSGATSAPELLPGGVRHLGQWLPPGAGTNLVRSAAYFAGHGAAGHLTVLIVWVVLGAAAVVVGHHAPIRFAAGATTPVPAGTGHVPEHELVPVDGAVNGRLRVAAH